MENRQGQILVQVNEDNQVDAKELHGFLEVGRDFPTWMKSRVEKYGFVEQIDFFRETLLPRFGEQNRGGSNRINYSLTLDMAKELCMVEQNEKGRQARRFFIECEKRLQNVTNGDPIIALRMEQLAYGGRINALEEDVSSLKDNVISLDDYRKPPTNNVSPIGYIKIDLVKSGYFSMYPLRTIKLWLSHIGHSRHTTRYKTRSFTTYQDHGLLEAQTKLDRESRVIKYTAKHAICFHPVTGRYRARLVD